MDYTEQLMAFGLTRQEAVVYWALLTEGPLTGYEVAKSTGISRSNGYTSLANL
ncbi:MAG: TrmB family transcriptional regulator, partial [Clostridia bacterium]|nr:TrmB family transcriptional regulator [Clostridia bacterium]